MCKCLQALPKQNSLTFQGALKLNILVLFVGTGVSAVTPSVVRFLRLPIVLVLQL